MFRKVETTRHGRVKIPVFTGMTVFAAVLRIDGMIGVVIRWLNSRLTLQRTLLKHALETRRYEGTGSGQKRLS